MRIGIPVARDRVIQQAIRAIRQMIEPASTEHFQTIAMVFRPHRSTGTALSNAAYYEEGYKIA
nr:hypothetical protein [Staphylococcus pseudintermedius]